MRYVKQKKQTPLHSRAWLTLRYRDQKKTAEEIATELSVSIVQVYRYLDKYGLRD
jgi:DNA-directed RNA polymerase specialized sigma subunit